MHVNSVDIQDHTDIYTDLGNQGATNTGENFRYIYTRAIVTIDVGLAQAYSNNHIHNKMWPLKSSDNRGTTVAVCTRITTGTASQAAGGAGQLPSLLLFIG